MNEKIFRDMLELFNEIYDNTTILKSHLVLKYSDYWSNIVSWYLKYLEDNGIIEEKLIITCPECNNDIRISKKEMDNRIECNYCGYIFHLDNDKHFYNEYYEFIDYNVERDEFIRGSVNWLNSFLRNSNLMNISGLGGI